MATPAPVRVSQLTDTLTAPARGDTVMALDASEPVVAAKLKQAPIETLAEHQGAYAEPTPAQQLDFATAFAVAPAGAVTDRDIGGLGGASWEIATAGQFAALPAGRALLTSSGPTFQLRLSWLTRPATPGDAGLRRSADAALNRLRDGDTLRFDSWRDNARAAALVASFLLVGDPVRESVTSTYRFTLRQIRTGSTITTEHRVPLGAVHPLFGLSTGVRQQLPTPYSDAVPQPPGTAAPGTSSLVSRADHVHPLPSLAELGLSTVAEIRRNTNRDIVLATTTGPRSVVTDGADIWVGANIAGGAEITAYDYVMRGRRSSRDIEVSGQSTPPNGMAVGSDRLWVVYGTGTVSSYNLSDLTPGAGGAVWSSGQIIVGMAADATHLYACSSTALLRRPFSDLASGNEIVTASLGTPGDPVSGIAIGDGTMWVLHNGRLEAYRLSPFGRHPPSDINDIPANAAGVAFHERHLLVVGGAAGSGTYARAYSLVDTVVVA